MPDLRLGSQFKTVNLRTKPRHKSSEMSLEESMLQSRTKKK